MDHRRFFFAKDRLEQVFARRNLQLKELEDGDGTGRLIDARSRSAVVAAFLLSREGFDVLHPDQVARLLASAAAIELTIPTTSLSSSGGEHRAAFQRRMRSSTTHGST